MPAHTRFRLLLGCLKRAVRQAARDYAFELRMPEPVKTTTVAPTGTIAKLPGVTEGTHPVYARTFLWRVRFSMTDPDQAAKVAAFEFEGYKVEPCVYDPSGNTMVVEFPTLDRLVAEVEARGYPADLVESADELSLNQMLAFQAMYQAEYADNAVSFTANVPEGLDLDETADVIETWSPPKGDHGHGRRNSAAGSIRADHTRGVRRVPVLSDRGLDRRGVRERRMPSPVLVPQLLPPFSAGGEGFRSSDRDRRPDESLPVDRLCAGPLRRLRTFRHREGAQERGRRHPSTPKRGAAR
ncbi:hypothetical protein [Streptomyces wedmorensis]|uniref:hypothetical protein n=1 Tax=Streptomyces wedmorensis TaxID=43759 RepID=UPI0037A4C6E3